MVYPINLEELLGRKPSTSDLYQNPNVPAFIDPSSRVLVVGPGWSQELGILDKNCIWLPAHLGQEEGSIDVIDLPEGAEKGGILHDPAKVRDLFDTLKQRAAELNYPWAPPQYVLGDVLKYVNCVAMLNKLYDVIIDHCTYSFIAGIKYLDRISLLLNTYYRLLKPGGKLILFHNPMSERQLPAEVAGPFERTRFKPVFFTGFQDTYHVSERMHAFLDIPPISNYCVSYYEDDKWQWALHPNYRSASLVCAFKPDESGRTPHYEASDTGRVEKRRDMLYHPERYSVVRNRGVRGKLNTYHLQEEGKLLHFVKPYEEAPKVERVPYFLSHNTLHTSFEICGTCARALIEYEMLRLLELNSERPVQARSPYVRERIHLQVPDIGERIGLLWSICEAGKIDIDYFNSVINEVALWYYTH
ncbi:hypothetical protein JW930_01215 [Candidatus Woesearchaeota archaeon]|nr:hypothetical protein [Candidatus Woesearchaeota archaeon]